MSTALELFNRVLLRLGESTYSGSPVFTSITGYKALVLDHLKEAQDLLLFDIKGSEPTSLIGEQEITLAVGADTNTLPADLFNNRLEYIYGLNSDDENIGVIDIISKKDYDQNLSNSTRGYIKAYIYDGDLVFTSVATIEQSLVLVYIKTPTALDTYDAECDIPEEFDIVLIYKALQLALESKDQAKSQIFASKYSAALRRMRASLNSYHGNHARVSSNKVKYTGSW